LFQHITVILVTLVFRSAIYVVIIYGDPLINNKDNKSSMSCHRMILPRFDKCIEVINGKEDIKISNDSKKTKNTTNDCHNRKLLSINKTDLLTVSALTE